MAKTNEIGYQAVPLAGGTMTGLLILSGDPVTALGAATKQYADAIAGGFTVKGACICTTTGNLNATPVGSGVGATLTNAGAQLAFSSDGVSPSVNARILVKDQALTQHNGIYTLTTVGSGATNWVLTRATDYDQPAEIQPGNLVPVTMGTLYAQTSWIQTATVVTVDTDPILFSQFTASPNTFATVSLSNLSAVAINTDLLPNADGAIDLGSAAFRFRNGYITSVRTGTSGGNSTNITAYDTGSASFIDIFTVSAGNPPTASMLGIVTSTTQAPGDNSTKFATTAYADAASALKANVSLNNLTSPTAINQDLLPGTSGTRSLGTGLLLWKDIFNQTMSTGQTLADALLIRAYNTNTASYTPFATLTAGNPPTMSLSGSVTTTTQAALDNSTKIATTAYVDAATGGGSGANTALSNLAAVAINTALLPGVDGTIDLGSAAKRFRNALIETLETGTTLGNTTLFQAYDTNGLAYTTFATLTAGNPPTMALSSAVTGTTQAPGNNTTALATTAFVNAAITAGSGANAALSNLAAVAINTTLLPTADNTIDLGSAAKRFRNALVETLQTGTTAAQTILLQAYNTNTAAYVTFATLTANNPPTMALSSAVTAVTQIAGDNSTKLATTAYVDSSSGANVSLSNLSAVAINTDLLGSADNSRSLGNATVRWKDVFATGFKTGTTAGNTYLLQAYDTNAASYTTFATLTANNPATMALASDVTGVTQSASNNSTKLATTAYADRMVPLAGGTMSGLLLLSGDPVAALGAVTKQYADAISAGLDVKAPVYAASTANLNATYLNGAAGIGATLVNAGALAAFSIDGVSPPINSRILVKDQTSTFQNGIYILSTVGSGAVAWILTRATDYDQAPSEIFPGNFIIVNNGTANATTAWIETAVVTTIGTDPITFNRFGQSITLPLSLANGGTNANLTASNGGIFYSTASAGAILAGTATAFQMLQSGATSTPAWSTATWPATTTVNQLLYSSSANVVAGLATANNGILVTSAGGVPSIGTAIPNGVTATTQSASDNSTKVATTAYVDAAAGGGGSLTLIASATASNSATVDFSNNLSATYDNYMLVWENCIVAGANTTFFLRVGTGAGPTYQATSYTTGMSPGSNAGTTGICLTKAADTSTAANRAGAGNVTVTNVNNASNDKVVVGTVGYWANSLADAVISVSGRWQGATVLTSLRFINSTGNITSGVFKLYGLKN